MRTRTRTTVAVLAATLALSAVTTAGASAAPAAPAAAVTRTVADDPVPPRDDSGAAAPAPTAPAGGDPAGPAGGDPTGPAAGTATPGGGPVGGTAKATPADPAAPPASSHCTETAAQELGWGAPARESDFDGTTVPPDWHPYGPEPGHNKKGTRTPEAVTVADGAMTISADADGNTGAVSWHPGQRYGRWEACVKSDEGRGGINALLLLWPVAEDFPVGGEVDWMEIMDDSRQKTSFFLHYGPGNDQDYGSVKHDSTQWSAYALEWTPEKITAYVNGKEWYSNTDTDQFPPRPMNMTMQLDYFGNAGGPTAMHMDWARQWALPQSTVATLSLPPGSAATGQPRDFPDRKPRELSEPEQQAQTAMLAREHR
ncbi:glycoside hydrolase family 16 protein [Pseudonocardia sp. ICBG1034]|uniref:glycoside hydrolase family 16 protein n=1 Tax=Pseudonocardia sp. ICBG1034 TaxID=2844381 RepID=UPI001CC948D8|nr:glycoside hydrolase family 16 protein [Pseudonocardia sp. ICBG1034]